MSKSLCLANLKNVLFHGIECDNRGYQAIERLYQACVADAVAYTKTASDVDTDTTEIALKSLFVCVADLRKEFRESSKISDLERANSTLLYNRLSVALRLWISKQSTKIQGLIKSLELVKTRKAGGGRKPAVSATDSSPSASNSDNNIVASGKQPVVTPDVVSAMVTASEKEAVKKLAEHLLQTYFVQANRELSSFKKQFPKIYAKQLSLYNHLRALLND